MTTTDLPIRTGRIARRRLAATLTRRPSAPEPERFILLIPYPIQPDDAHDTPVSLLKRMAAMDHHDTAVDLGCRYLTKPEVTVHHGENPSITVLAHVEVVSYSAEHVEARAPFLERGRATTIGGKP